MDRLDKFILFIIILYSIIFAVISVNRYWQYQAHYFDTGLYDEAIWKAAHFQLPTVDKGENGRIVFADHFEPGMFLLSPLYWFTDKREVLFIAQVIAVSVSSWIAYKIASSRLKNPIVISALIVAYLGFIGMQNALITEFHPIVLAVLPLILCFWSIENKRWKLFFLSLFFVLSLKENNAGLVIGLGLYLLLKYGKLYFRQAITIIFIGLIWGIVTMKIIIPSFNNGKYAYTPNHLKGLGVPSILELFYDEKIKRETLFYTFSTFGFLPLLDVAIYPLVIEHYLERFVFTQQGTRFDLGFHYNSILVPVLFMGTLNIFDKLRKRTFPLIITIYSVVIIVWVILFSTFVYHGPIGLFFNLDFYRQRKNLTYMDDFVKIFPKSGIVLTQSNLGARLTHGPNVRLLRDPFVYLHPDYVILDLTPGQRIIGVDPMAVKIKDYYLEDDAYILTKVHDDQYLFSKK